MEKESRCRDCGDILNRRNYSPPKEFHETLVCHDCRKIQNDTARQVIEQHIRRNRRIHVRADTG